VSSPAIESELRRADADARAKAIACFDRPLFVEAGAGTGKTTTLVARIVAWCVGPGWDDARALVEANRSASDLPRDRSREQLVAERALSGVLAITFTEAAAAEMEAKIRAALATLESGEWPRGIVEHAALVRELGVSFDVARGRAARLLAALDRRVVLTIHAWCRELSSQHPLEAGVAPLFRVDADGFETERVVRDTLEAAIVRSLGDEPDEDWLVLARARVGPAEIEEALLALARNGVRSEDIARDPFTPERIERLFAELEQSTERFARIAAPLIAPVKGVARAASVLESIERTSAAVASAERWSMRELDRVCETFRPAWDSRTLKQLAEWSRGEFGAKIAKAIGENARAIRDAALDLLPHVERVSRLKPALASSARRVLERLLAQAHDRLRVRGIATFGDLLRDARDLLRDHPDVADALRRRTRQVLVDEFQDTDPLQCDLVRMLAFGDGGDRGGSHDRRPGLFVVGDPKQSIYAWRNADLAAYEAFQRDLAAAGGEFLRLSVNYRSTPVILHEVERAIAPVMVAESGVQPEFQPLVAHAKTGGAPVEHWISWELDRSAPKRLSATSAERATEIEARWLAKDLLRRREEGVRWNDVALLLRTTSSLEIYLRALREHGVDFEVAGDKSYYRRREIIDAASLVRCIIDPHDHLALVGALRSSVVGVPDAALIPLWVAGFPAAASALGGDEPDSVAHARAILRRALAGVPSDAPGLDRIRGWEDCLFDALDKIDHLRRSFARDAHDVFVERLRTLFASEAIEAARPLGAWRAANLERFFRHLARALVGGGDDPRAVLRALERALRDERHAEDARPRSASADAVQVMTIHKAKGLDFAHVYVASMHRESRRETLPALDVARRGESTEFVFFGAPSPDYGEVQAARVQHGSAELVRTLYVAMTRAKDRLVLMGSWPAKSAAKPVAECGTHLELLAHSAPSDLVARLSSCAETPDERVDIEGSTYLFAPPEQPADAARAPDDDLLDAASVESDVRALRELARAGARRMERPFSAAISSSAENTTRDADDDRAAIGRETRRARGSSRPRPAALAGTAMHLALEEFDWNADLALEIARRREALAISIGADAQIRANGTGDESDAHEALQLARSVFDRFVRGKLFARLAALREHFVARELAVLSLPQGDEAPVGYFAGAIDLVYRDPQTHELVVVDYKTDALGTPEEARERASEYASQARAYPRAVRAALGLESDPRFELWFLQADCVVEVAHDAAGAA
jgi:ATP-dependent helicase/nuclease subunit A